MTVRITYVVIPATSRCMTFIHSGYNLVRGKIGAIKEKWFWCVNWTSSISRF